MGTGESGIYITTSGSKTIGHEALIHAIDGEFVHDPRTGKPTRLRSGGHTNITMEIMDRHNIEYIVEKTYENGVRVGRVPNHKEPMKKQRALQTWFPESWTLHEILKAGEYVSSLTPYKSIKDAKWSCGVYKEVRVQVINYKGKVTSIFPDIDQTNITKRRNK